MRNIVSISYLTYASLASFPDQSLLTAAKLENQFAPSVAAYPATEAGSPVIVSSCIVEGKVRMTRLRLPFVQCLAIAQQFSGHEARARRQRS